MRANRACATYACYQQSNIELCLHAGWFSFEGSGLQVKASKNRGSRRPQNTLGGPPSHVDLLHFALTVDGNVICNITVNEKMLPISHTQTPTNGSAPVLKCAPCRQGCNVLVAPHVCMQRLPPVATGLNRCRPRTPIRPNTVAVLCFFPCGVTPLLDELQTRPKLQQMNTGMGHC